MPVDVVRELCFRGGGRQHTQVQTKGRRNEAAAMTSKSRRSHTRDAGNRRGRTHKRTHTHNSPLHNKRCCRTFFLLLIANISFPLFQHAGHFASQDKFRIVPKTRTRNSPHFTQRIVGGVISASPPPLTCTLGYPPVADVGARKQRNAGNEYEKKYGASHQLAKFALPGLSFFPQTPLRSATQMTVCS